MTERQPAQIERDRRKIGSLYLRGAIQADIAEELGLSQATVSRDIHALIQDWQRDAARDIGERKAQELAKVDTLELEYWQAWKRSQEDAETNEQKGTVVGETIKAGEVKKITKGQAGDPRFLQGVEWCIERRCKILGVDAPDKHDLTSAGEKITWAQFIGKEDDADPAPDSK